MSAGRNTCTLAEQALEDCRQALEEVIHTEPARRGSPSITNKCAWALQAIEDYRRAAAETEVKDTEHVGDKTLRRRYGTTERAAAEPEVKATLPTPIVDARRGANWTPPPCGKRSFLAQGDSETCLLCGKHIARHYGMTEYRCDPKDGAP